MNVMMTQEGMAISVVGHIAVYLRAVWRSVSRCGLVLQFHACFDSVDVLRYDLASRLLLVVDRPRSAA